MKRILSGIRSNSEPTLGNYLGALKPWVEAHKVESSNEHFFFIPNLHSLNNRDGVALRANTLSNLAWFLAAGLDPSKVTIFAQSQIPAHSEMAWIFNNYVTMGELSRQTQFKDKASKGGAEGQLVGMFTYPALMAADILLYDANEVPVGDDQKQHVELARDIATRFNNLYGPTFVVPEVAVPVAGARVMNLQDPSSKMSKSDTDQSGNIMLLDGHETISHKIKRAITSSGEGYGPEAGPGIANLLEIFAAIDGVTVSDASAQFGNIGYGEFKTSLAQHLIEHLAPIQRRRNELMEDQPKLLAILEDGRKKANAIAIAKLTQVKDTLGLL